ncbi:hypothetical protein SLS61_001482 [Didymella pomorum]
MATTEPSLPNQAPTVPEPSEPSLPKLSQHDFRIYNRMAEHMDYFHNHFRETWNVIHIFPVLAKKQPAFKKELELLTQHKQIHKGLDKLTKYLEECSTGERELRLSELKDIMDSFGKVLWQHLDDEVKELGAENMRKYWTKEEMARLPM